MEHLDARLGTIAAMVPRCRAVADIGCDHGLLVAALLEGGRCDYGIAADINPMPLEKARPMWAAEGIAVRPDGLGCRMREFRVDVAALASDYLVAAVERGWDGNPSGNG